MRLLLLYPFSLAESALLFLPHNREREKAFRHHGFISCKLEFKTEGLNGSVNTPAFTATSRISNRYSSASILSGARKNGGCMIESTQHLSFRLIRFVSSCLTFRGMSLLRGRGSDLGRGEICVSFCCQAWCCCHPHNLFFIYRSCSIPLNLLSPPFWQLAQRCFLPTGFSFRSR